METWLIWTFVAAVLVIAEIFSGTFFLLCFGIGAAVGATVAASGFGAVGQWTGFFLVSAVAVLISRRFAERISGGSERKANADRLVGQTALVIQTIDASAGTGRVRVLHDDWRAEADSVIAEGTKVSIKEIRGTHLLVEDTG